MVEQENGKIQIPRTFTLVRQFILGSPGIINPELSLLCNLKFTYLLLHESSYICFI